MRLRKLILHNVRRFADKTVTLGPFGDGLTTITEENERGKSTFFDALHALIFHDYGSARKEIRDLQPYSGGAVQIAAEIELGSEAYRIEKLFNLKKAGSSARIINLATGAILKQADDAEQWIHDTILSSSKGPVGLLWVRQGTVGVDAAKAEAEGVDARRDVMSSVRGQIDAVTGGRRMDTILQRCRSELDAIATKSGKPKAGSQWKEAEDLAESLREQQAKLQKSVDALSHDLEMKKRLTKRLRALNDPALRARRGDAIKASQAELAAARDHDRRIKEAEQGLKLLMAQEQDIERTIKEIGSLRDRREALRQAISEREATLAKIKQAKAQAQAAMAQQQATISERETERRNLNDALSHARQQERSREKRRRLIALGALLASLQEPLSRLAEAERILKMPTASPADLDRLANLEHRRDIAREKRKIHFSSFVLSSQGEQAKCAGAILSDGEAQLIDRPLDITLPGFGAIQLRPAEGAAQAIEDPDALQAEINATLGALGFETVTAARAAHDAHRKAQDAKQLAQAQIRASAPDGLEALRREQDQLCTELGCTIEQAASLLVDDNANAPRTSETMEHGLRDLDEALSALRGSLPKLQDRFTHAANALTEADVLLGERRKALADLAPPADEEAQLDQSIRARSDLAPKLATARAQVNQLQQQAPDLAATEAAHQRALQADEQDRKEIHLQETELARLNGAIQTQSEGAVEEKLAEVSGRLTRALERAAQFASHAKAIDLLITHLEAARAQAQETYFEPIRQELLPLLRQLHAGADFQIDADKLLIDTITRNGITDKVDVLSGGAYEQIAILTRLAFAKLFAKRGSHVPIILDDALVHTDDERISTMFNMLAQMAKDQQIIVLSCRTRAFSDLGGERAFISEGHTADAREH
nr:AAA family ATPase [uncultured Cohaesibacter sp.]